ncbi:MAG: hypothetical protein WCD79_20640, partial [Chthoniobacteraceae bacterium]
QAVIEETQPLRSVQIALFDRGNMSNDVSFEITTLHTSYGVALDFAARRRQTLGNIANLLLNVPDEGYTATLPGAGWKTTGAKRDGLTSIVSYTVRGGEFSITSGSVGTGFGLPVLLENQIDPFVIPSGTVASVNTGQLFVCRSLECDGELDLNGECALIGEN